MALALLDTIKNKLFGGPKKECGTNDMKGACGTEGKSKGDCHEEEEEDKASSGCCGGGCH